MAASKSKRNKAYRQKPVKLNPMQVAQNRMSVLTHAECRQIMKEIPRERQGWWADVSAGQTLLLRQAVQSDLDRCTLSGPRSKNPDDYMCETFERGSLVSKEALEYMNPEQLVFALVGGVVTAPVLVPDCQICGGEGCQQPCSLRPVHMESAA